MTTSPRFVRTAGVAIAFGGAAWVLKYSLTVGAPANEQLHPLCGALWLAGFSLPLGVALALTIYATGRAHRIAQVGAFVLFAAALLFLAGLTAVSVSAFARATLTDAPRTFTDELPVLVMGMTGLLVAPLFWQQPRLTA